MKLCRDCKYFIAGGYGTVATCGHPESPRDPVYGGITGRCELMRSRNCCIPHCGYEGNWFEAGEQPRMVPVQTRVDACAGISLHLDGRDLSPNEFTVADSTITIHKPISWWRRLWK